jgi:hypothetical protein
MPHRAATACPAWLRRGAGVLVPLPAAAAAAVAAPAKKSKRLKRAADILRIVFVSVVYVAGHSCLPGLAR